MSKYVTKQLFSSVNKYTQFEGNNGIGYFTSFKSSFLGKGSYIGNRCHLSNVKIGRFCSIGDEVSVICGSHPIGECISTHPAFYSRSNFSGLSYVETNSFEEFKHTEANYLISIGNDVWIGSHSKVLQGVTIGDGAVIAAGALVVKDVLPYTVVGGVPAKQIKKRFSDDDIDLLEKIKWWNWSDDELIKHSSEFMNPASFIEGQRRKDEERK